MIAAAILYFILICMGFTVSATNTKLLWHLSQREIEILFGSCQFLSIELPLS